MNAKLLISTLAGAIACGGALFVASSALAVPDRENDAVTDLRAARISLNEAVARSVAQFGGQPVSAELDREHGRLAYEIELVNGAAVREVQLDAITGVVIASRDDTIDTGDDENGAQEPEED